MIRLKNIENLLCSLADVAKHENGENSLVNQKSE